MEHHCYRCGSQVEDQTPFCPSCGAPQIRVPSREPQAEARHEAAPPPPPPSVVLPEPTGYARPIRIHWKGFLRIAAPLALISGLTGLYPPLGLPVFLASVVASVYLYRKRHLGPLSAFQGAQLGAFMGLLSYLTLVIPSSASCALARNACREGLVSALRDAAKFNPTPQAQELLQSLQQSDARLFGFLAFAFFVALLFMLAFGAVTGALAAGLSRDKPSS